MSKHTIPEPPKPIKPTYADDNHESIGVLFKLRAPSLMVGLILGIGISFVTSNYEAVLSQDIHIAYFLPFIVYIADAVGTQTESIYSRKLKSWKEKVLRYIRKEFTLGIIFWVVFGLLSGLIAYLWLQDELLAYTVGAASFLAIATAPLVALAVATLSKSAHADPAAATWPIATVLQDMISVVIFGTVATMILLK